MDNGDITEFTSQNHECINKSLLSQAPAEVQIQSTLNKPLLISKECCPKLPTVEKTTYYLPFGPNNHPLVRLFSSFLCLAVLWTLLFALLKDELLPGGKLLTLILLVSAAYISGDIFKYLGLPKVLGMLLSGIIIRNMGVFFDTEEKDVYSDVVTVTKFVEFNNMCS